jgi:hypothetical protein
MRSFMIFLLSNCFFGDQIKEDETGSAHGMYAEDISIQDFDGENCRKETTSKI